MMIAVGIVWLVMQELHLLHTVFTNTTQSGLVYNFHIAREGFVKDDQW